ncbi:hypothetical protein [Brevibacillus borstelensis]|uniref:hypothetical protein n=1 Tax=Brevibacillus TaxID=55080 RepID=UPI000F0859AE|nr:hypothetical protein [Brevibacillus borstelensis]MBE5398294.1 hypothetical protein [Brevibacillus borstelensis]MED1876613.1 hypothetical protein [Brevibacillus borstelensis]MED1881258.1 hypothetical protein [Brevibacillus borstelensis]RNB66098.1 hypothetical protein EDM54_02365 [Brevibacillus borstelensis]WNF05841.1 hypothetical protein RFB14_26780 [Brevibacillus borstelensis]
MKRFLIYTLIVVASYITGILAFKATYNLLSIPEGSEYDLLFTGINLFFIFTVLPAYFFIMSLFRLFQIRSIILMGITLILFGIIPSTFVPFLGGFGFIYLNSQYFQSELFILLYSFFAATAIAFSIGLFLSKKTLTE